MESEPYAWILVNLGGSRVCRGSGETFLSTIINLLCGFIYLEIAVMFFLKFVCLILVLSE